MSFWFNTSYACGLVEVDNEGTIVFTCPIYRWMRGRNIRDVVNMLKGKKQFLGAKQLQEACAK